MENINNKNIFYVIVIFILWESFCFDGIENVFNQVNPNLILDFYETNGS